MSKIIFLFVSCLINFVSVIAQDEHPERLYWSDTRRINLKDFGIQTKSEEGLSSVVFEIEYGVKGFNFLRKNFNKKITHYMLCPVSQITVDDNVDQYIQYQQTLFDIEEIYVRRLRKQVAENRRKLLFTSKIVDDLKEQIIDTELRMRQAQYNNETNRGTDLEKQIAWQKMIRQELDELNDFAYDN